MEARSGFRNALVKIVSLVVLAGTMILGRAWLGREPARVRDAAGRTWYIKRGNNAARRAEESCWSLDERAAYLDGPYAGSEELTFCCGPPDKSSLECDRP